MLTDRRTAADGTAAPGSLPDGRTGRPADRDRTPDLRAPGGIRRLVTHAAALLVALLAIVVVVDNGASAITDEGAVIAQVDAVSDGSWAIELPLVRVDPDGEFVTMENSVVTDGTYLPYAKHPAYPVLLLPFWSLGGHLGLLVASALGTWAAAVIAMFLTRRLVRAPAPTGAAAHASPGVSRRTEDLGLATLWLLGLGSPLLFGATTVMAHSIGAALTGAVALALIAGLDAGVPVRRRVPLVVVALVLAVPLVLLRSEGLFAVAGLAAALGCCAIRSVRPPRVDLSRLATAVVLAGLGVASYVLDGRLAALVQGDEGISNFRISAQEVGFVEGRVQALWASVLRPGDPRLGTGAVVLLVATVCLIAGAVVLRRAPGRPGPAVSLIVVGAALTVVRQFLPLGHVTGLIAAFPLLLMGLVQLRRADVASLTARVCLIASAVTASLVLATSYAIGGAAEWGGRFAHGVPPPLVPLAVLGAAHALEATSRNPTPIRSRGTDSESDVPRMSPDPTRIQHRGIDSESDFGAGAAGETKPRTPRGTARVLTAAVLVATASMSLLCVRTGIAMRDDTEQVVERMLGIAGASAAPSDGGPPIVVTDARGLGRVSWAHLDEVRILRMPEPGQLQGLLDRLAAADVGAVVLAVHPDERLDSDTLGEWTVARDHHRPGSAWRHVELVQQRR